MDRELTKKMKALKTTLSLHSSVALSLPVLPLTLSASARRLRGVKTSSQQTQPTFLVHHLLKLTSTTCSNLFGTTVNQLTQYTHLWKVNECISSFTSGATKFVENKDHRLVNAVDVYESDTAKLCQTIRSQTRYTFWWLHRCCDSWLWSSALTEDTWATAWYRKPFTKALAETGDFTAKELITELTLEALPEKANAKQTVVLVLPVKEGDIPKPLPSGRTRMTPEQTKA